MVAYSFKAQFVAPICVGLSIDLYTIRHIPIAAGVEIRPKRQTIRGRGLRRHARPGEIVQLYYAQRSKNCHKIGEARCISAQDILLSYNKIEIAPDDPDWREIRTRDGLDEFAQADGFSDWKEMQEFWRKEHGDTLTRRPFPGVLIQWEPTN